MKKYKIPVFKNMERKLPLFNFGISSRKLGWEWERKLAKW